VFTDDDKVWVGLTSNYTVCCFIHINWIIQFTICIPMSFRKAFHDELTLLQKVRHPNVVQFLGAVTQSTPMMIVTEYLPQVSVDAALGIMKVLMIFYI
jgi:serine/threonine protein kinase